MQTTRRQGIKSLAALAVAGRLAPVRAQADWPTRPVKIIVPVAPGGGVDMVGRTIGERLTRALGQPFVVENISGGGGIVASTNTARAAPDGYTLMVGYVGTTAPTRRCASCRTTRLPISRRSRWWAARRTCWSCIRRSRPKAWLSSSKWSEASPAA